MHDSRYSAGNLLFADAVIVEARRMGVPNAELERMIAVLGRSFEPLLTVVSKACVREELAPVYEELERRGREAGIDCFAE